MRKQNSISGLALGIIGTTAVCISGIADAYTVQQVTAPGFSATVEDKVFSGFQINGADPLDSVTIIRIGSVWQVNLDATASGNPLQGPGTISYQVNITDPTKFFYQASADLQGGALAGVYSTTLAAPTLTPSPLISQNPGGSSQIGTFTEALKTIQVTGTWSALDAENYINSISHKFTQASGSINLVKTVGTDPNVCANTNDITVEPGTTVYYCYTVTNTGPVRLVAHSLFDDKLGQLLTDAVYNLEPGKSVSTMGPGGLGLNASAAISVDTPNTATWTGCTSTNVNSRVCFDASSMANVRVKTTPPPPSKIPTLSEWAMIMMVGFMAILGGLGVRRRESL